MQEVLRNAPDIIREAARSGLGLAALIILALAIIGVIFFKQEKVQLKTLMFVLMFTGFIVFGYAISHVSNSPQTSLIPTSGITPSLPDSPTSITTSASSPAPTTMLNTPTPALAMSKTPNATASWNTLIYGVEWRVSGIQPEEKLTRFYIDIRNIEEKDEKSFYAFNKTPLVVIDDNGGSYKMLNSSAAPEGIREQREAWYLQPRRAITVAVDFAPLAKGNTSGRILYRDNNNAEPAKFSFGP